MPYTNISSTDNYMDKFKYHVITNYLKSNLSSLMHYLAKNFLWKILYQYSWKRFSFQKFTLWGVTLQTQRWHKGETALATHWMTYATSTNFNNFWVRRQDCDGKSRSGSNLLACSGVATAEEPENSKSEGVSEEIPLENGILSYNF